MNQERVGDQVTFKLNGKEVSVPKGWTVMQATQREQVKVPHFCWHPGLSIAGVCRFCMVRVEGRPKLEVACNLPAIDGMVVDTLSDDVKEAHKWALEFHLVNHPLDCPICDQAGECGLQDYYMEVGRYKSQVTGDKVLKPKALDVGSALVLDTERCILCSRCVRFEEEVTKTNGLGILDRGDRAIISTYNGEKITHQYQENLVDICPVGAFTSRQFRFKQRVWFLKEKDSICPGCSTGCKISVHSRPELRTYYRIKPVLDEEVNGHWMCDLGRTMFRHLNPDERLDQASSIPGEELPKKQSELTPSQKRAYLLTRDALRILAQRIEITAKEDIALLISAQYTTEEYESLLQLFVTELGIRNVYPWRDSGETIDSFDQILLRGDRNANTQGLHQSLATVHLDLPVKNEFEKCLKSQPKVLIALCPEISASFPNLKAELGLLNELPFVSLWTCSFATEDFKGLAQLIPMKGFTEKKGSYINAMKKKRELLDPYPSVIYEAKDVIEAVHILREYLP
ncbi:MAG: (2Fe-2S)-binding protein [Oligoflexales bacterium]|nr:(2Fe-2S)-binding protein [Oligoflexales bacterium]